MTGCPTCPETEHECRNWDWSGHCAECGEKTLPEWERELLARQEQAAQPDRPAPVDPSEVRVGDVVEIEGDDWMVRAPVTDVDDPNHDGPRYPQDSPFGVMVNKLMWWPKLADATVRILRRAAPEPDEVTVAALAKELASAADASVFDASTKQVPTGRHWKEFARELVRRGNVHVEVPDA